MTATHYITQRLNLNTSAIENTLRLFDEGCTIPFISRYRKEMTGNLDETQIENISKYQKEFLELEKRRASILNTLREQEVLTNDLEARILQAEQLTVLEDLYLPYKKTRTTKADKARARGLEPLARIIMAQNARDLEDRASGFTNKEVASAEEALEGARHIIAEWINERLDIRNHLRRSYERHAELSCKVVKTKSEEEEAQKYRDYFDWTEALHRCPSHRLLAILRASNEGYIRININIDEDRALDYINTRIIRSNNACAVQLELAAKDAFKRLLAPSLSNEALSAFRSKAEATAIEVFAKNLRQLLLGAPLGEKRILALDPGFRTGCKLVCLGEGGELLHNETIFPHPPQKKDREAIKKLSTLVNAYKIEAIAIGNGTASRETEALVKRVRFDRDLQVFVVNEAGASVYSASPIARQEFPNYDVTVRGAVSIGRRLADPLAELVKIDPKSIGVGQYQHDVDQNKLKEELDLVVSSCVNKVGVNLNTASESLLSYVSGIGPALAANIVEWRKENGKFTNRKQLKEVKRLGEKAFEQSAAFLRVKQGDHPLDNSAVHPERYKLVQDMAKDMKMEVNKLIGNREAIIRISPEKYVSKDVGMPTLEDILKELEKPGLDPREKAKVFEFAPHIKTINDLKTGEILPGIVNNITNFGCFVDIGIKESGLVHISKLKDGFVSDVNEVVSLHEHVRVRVESIDLDRKRIQLSMNFREGN
ncbi:Tex family protein [Robertkochia flava]|uniref:Tex family protein n=1 Tax=Robertkochia flava TaxID=3447986 RepID=UPI001CC91481|nr:Tex family protein [Robertkochia marina]